MAKSRVQHAFKGIPEEQINEFVIYGTPEDISRQIELIEQAGIQYLIVALEPSRELEALDIFANKVIKTNVLGNLSKIRENVHFIVISIVLYRYDTLDTLIENCTCKFFGKARFLYY
jgi:hypothetical protein